METIKIYYYYYWVNDKDGTLHNAKKGVNGCDR